MPQLPGSFWDLPPDPAPATRTSSHCCNFFWKIEYFKIVCNFFFVSYFDFVKKKLMPCAVLNYMGAFLPSSFAHVDNVVPVSKKRLMAAPVTVARQKTKPVVSGTFRSKRCLRKLHQHALELSSWTHASIQLNTPTFPGMEPAPVQAGTLRTLPEPYTSSQFGAADATACGPWCSTDSTPMAAFQPQPQQTLQIWCQDTRTAVNQQAGQSTVDFMDLQVLRPWIFGRVLSFLKFNQVPHPHQWCNLERQAFSQHIQDVLSWLMTAFVYAVGENIKYQVWFIIFSIFHYFWFFFSILIYFRFIMQKKIGFDWFVDLNPMKLTFSFFSIHGIVVEGNCQGIMLFLKICWKAVNLLA